MKNYLSLYGMAAIAALLTSTLTAAELAKSDAAFIKKAADGGMTEVKLGELAKDKATRQEVKDFGAMMATDHGNANNELKALAEKKGVSLPEAPKARHESTIDHLSKLSGEEFDKAYVNEMVKDHKADVKEFEEASKELKDPEVKAFAEKTLPTLKTHLEKIESLKDSLK